MSKGEELISRYLPRVIGFGLNILSYLMPEKVASLALDIFRKPRKGKIQSYQKKFLQKFIQTPLKLRAMDVMTYDNGKKGKTVLFCHGWESNSSRWRKLYRTLQNENLRIILMDAPAHGASGSERFDGILYRDMIDVVSKHYKPDIIVGHSIGGFSSIFYASFYQPEWLRSLVIMASPDRLMGFTNKYFDMMKYSKRVRKSYFKISKEVWGHEIDYFSMAEHAKAITIPGTIIHDREDDINFYSEGKSIHENWKNSELISTSGYGHSLQSEEVYEKVKKCLLN